MTMPYRPARRGLVLTTAAALALSAPAMAQEAEEGVFQMLGRIIFGTGTAKVAIDTPQAVTALEQEDLDRKQADTIGDLLKAVPGVQSAGASTRPMGQAFNIRGIGNSEQTASEERIKVVVDGAPKFFEQYRMGSFFGDIELFKRVDFCVARRPRPYMARAPSGAWWPSPQRTPPTTWPRVRRAHCASSWATNRTATC